MPRKSAASAVASLKRSAMKPDDDLPEVTDAMLADAELRVGERVIRRGRPPSAAPKEAIKLRIDRDVLAYYRARRPRLADAHQRDVAQGRQARRSQATRRLRGAEAAWRAETVAELTAFPVGRHRRRHARNGGPTAPDHRVPPADFLPPPRA